MKAKVILVIRGVTVTISKSLTQYVFNIPGNMKFRNYKKQQYWALHTYCRKYKHKSAKHFSVEVTLHIVQFVNTEQLQHYILQKHDDDNNNNFHIWCINMLV